MRTVTEPRARHCLGYVIAAKQETVKANILLNDSDFALRHWRQRMLSATCSQSKGR